MLLQYNQLV